MGKNKIKKQMHSESAVSEILGTILLFAMALALFSVLYISIIPMDSVQSSTSSNIIGYIQDGNIILEHHGGSSVTTESYLRFNIGGSMSIVNISSTFLHDTNNNSKWDIGEKIVYSAEIGGLQVETFVINEPSNSVIFSATLQYYIQNRRIMDKPPHHGGKKQEDQNQVAIVSHGAELKDMLEVAHE